MDAQLRAKLILLAALGTTAASASGAQQPGPIRMLPGDLAQVAAAGQQESADIARGGNAYLVVWEDDRASLTGSLDSGGMVRVTDILAARVDLQGQLIDTTPIVIDSGPFSQSRPHVAWNGSMWLVIWESERTTQFWHSRNVLATRVSPAGQVLDTVPIVIDDDDYIDEQPWDVASDGSDFAVIWQDEAAGSWSLDGARVDSSGVVSGKRTVYLPPNQFQAPWNARLAWAGNRYLIAYGDTYGIRGLLADSALNQVGVPFVVGSGDVVQVASDGSGFYVAFGEGGTWGTVRGTPVSSTGAVAVPGGTALSGSVYPIDPHPVVAHDGSGWTVLFEGWTFPSGGQLWGSRVDQTGTLQWGPSSLVPGGVATRPAIGAGNGGVFAAWTDDRNAMQGYGEHDLYGATVSGAGQISASAPLAAGPPAQFQVDVAGDATQRLVVFVSAGDGGHRILAQRVDAFGVALDAQPLELASGSPDLQRPAVSFDGDRYLVVWEDFRGSVFQSRILGRRVGRDGRLLDPAPVDLMPGNNPDVASLGGEHLVVATNEPINHSRNCVAQRVSGASGQPLGAYLVLGGSYARNPAVSAFADRWMVAWQQNGSHDSPWASIATNWVLAGGTMGTAWFPVNSTITEYDPDLAVGDGVALLVWNDGADLRGVRMLADGSLLDPLAGFMVSAAPEEQLIPAVAWDGLEWVVSWTDWRDGIGLIPSLGDPYFGRVTAAGTPRDGAGQPYSADPQRAQGSSAVDATRGITAAAWAAFVPEGSYGNVRVALSALAPTLDVTPAHRGQPVQLTVAAAQPGDVAYFAYSTAGRGPGSTVAALGGLGIDLLANAQLLGSVPVGAAGTATLQATVPSAVPLVTVHLQALLRRGPSGTLSSKTDVLGVPLLP